MGTLAPSFLSPYSMADDRIGGIVSHDYLPFWLGAFFSLRYPASSIIERRPASGGRLPAHTGL